jgi:carboxymethylenebutenolidase
MIRTRSGPSSILQVALDRRTALLALLATASGCAGEEKIAMTQAASPAPHDLGAMFDAHVRHEFVDKDLDATMRTMTGDPYVFHVPTMTGGVGWNDLRAFYGTHFIGHWPDDTQVTPVSRTIGANQVVDELVISFTHDREIPISLPGIAPTGRKIVLPHAVVMGFKDGLVAHEHIYWDQASALVQAGLLDPAHVPAVGARQAQTLLAHVAARRPPAPGSNTGHDLGAVFDRHVSLEFVEKDVDATLTTMAAEPYVWNVPTALGGDGLEGVRRFYEEKFVGRMPADTAVSSISRTVGQDQVVDESILTFTHDGPVEFMLPGVAPTGRRVVLPHVVVMGFEGGKVTHEHIYWDQASLLVQVGLLDPATVPTVGAEAAQWMRDRSPPLNRLLRA